MPVTFATASEVTLSTKDSYSWDTFDFNNKREDSITYVARLTRHRKVKKKSHIDGIRSETFEKSTAFRCTTTNQESNFYMSFDNNRFIDALGSHPAINLRVDDGKKYMFGGTMFFHSDEMVSFTPSQEALREIMNGQNLEISTSRHGRGNFPLKGSSRHAKLILQKCGMTIDTYHPYKK